MFKAKRPNADGEVYRGAYEKALRLLIGLQEEQLQSELLLEDEADDTVEATKLLVNRIGEERRKTRSRDNLGELPSKTLADTGRQPGKHRVVPSGGYRTATIPDSRQKRANEARTAPPSRSRSAQRGHQRDVRQMEQKAKTLEERMEQKVEKLQRRLYQVECRRLACEDVLELQQKHAEDAEDERERPPNPDQKNIYKQLKDCGLWGEYLDRRNKMMERYASKLSVLKDSTEDIKGNYEEPQQKAKQALGRAELELRQAQAEKETGRPRAKASELERSEAPRTISMDRSQRDRGAGIEPTLQPQGNGKEWYSQHSQGAAPQPKRNGEGSLLYEDDDPIIVAPLRPQKDKALIGSHENRPTTRTEQNENSPTRNNKSKLATILGKKGKTLASQDVLKNEPAPVPERTKNASMRAIQKEPVEVLELDNEPPISRSQSILATISKNDGKASTRDNHMDPTPIPEQNGKASDRYNQIDPTMQAENCEIRTSNNENKRAPERGEYRKAPSSYGKYKPTPITKKYGEAPPSPNQSNAPPAHQARPFTSSSKTPSTTASRQNEPSLSMQKSKASTAYTPHEPERKEEGSKASDRKLNRSDQHTIPGQKGQASNTSDKKSNTPASGPPQIGKAPKSYVQIKNLNPDLNTAPAAAAPMKSRLRDFLRG